MKGSKEETKDSAETGINTEPVDSTGHGTEPRVTSPYMTDSAAQNPRRSEVDGDLKRAELLAELSQLVRDWLSRLPPASFSSFFSYFTIRQILGLELDLPQTGIDSV